MQELKNKDAAVVVFSGGQDSTTCLFWALKRYKKVIALSFDYHQKHVKELECAKKICRDHEVEHHIMDMSLLNQLAPNSLTRVDIKVDESAPEEGTPNSFVDGRNLLFLSYAAVFAKQRGITDIITGVSQSDFSGYPDCRDMFIKSLNTTLCLAMDYQFDIITPLMWLDKKETWALADELGAFDIIRNETLTCYNGIIGDGCGHCPSCKLRKKGLDAYLASKQAFAGVSKQTKSENQIIYICDFRRYEKQYSKKRSVLKLLILTQLYKTQSRQNQYFLMSGFSIILHSRSSQATNIAYGIPWELCFCWIK